MTTISHAHFPRDGEPALGRLWWVPLVRGLMLLILGVYAVVHPAMTVVVLVQVIGAFVVFDGILGIIAGIAGSVPSRGWTILRGVLEVLVGLFVFANSVLFAGVTAMVLIYVLAVSAVVFGVLEIVAAIQERKVIESPGWVILSGVALVLFGILLLMAPVAFGLMMIMVLGVFAIISGISLMILAFRLRGMGRAVRAHHG